MANKKVTSSDDPLVDAHFKISKSQKDFLDSLGESSSAFIRKLIAAQMDGFDVELSKLTAEEKDLEIKLKQVQAQKQQILDAINKKHTTIQGREELLEKQVTELLSSSIGTQKRPCANLRTLKNPIKFRVEGINRKLNGNGAEPITEREFTEMFVTKAKVKGVELYDK